jgi:hypothetical protein
MGRGIPVFAVRFGQDPYGFIGRFQAFSSDGKSPTDLAKELFEVYRNHKQTERRMAEVMVTRFVESESFAAAKKRIAYLEQLNIWDRSFSKLLESSIDSNTQILGAWGVPDRVKELVKTWAGRST